MIVLTGHYFHRIEDAGSYLVDTNRVAGVAGETRPAKVLFVHTPKAGGSNLIDYFTQAVGYHGLQSQHTDDQGVWHDFDLDDLAGLVNEPDGFLSTHTLSLGWSRLVSAIPDASPDEIGETLRQFKHAGWFTFTVVRHPGDLLCSFYHYILDHHRRGHDPAVALHVPAVGIPLDAFIAAHCNHPLLPAYWADLDDCLITNDEALTGWFSRRFAHEYQPVPEWRHASGSRGYEHYCAIGQISDATQDKLDRSPAMIVYRDILDHACRTNNTTDDVGPV
jgi:hypothetical protein